MPPSPRVSHISALPSSAGPQFSAVKSRLSRVRPYGCLVLVRYPLVRVPSLVR